MGLIDSLDGRFAGWPSSKCCNKPEMFQLVGENLVCKHCGVFYRKQFHDVEGARLPAVCACGHPKENHGCLGWDDECRPDGEDQNCSCLGFRGEND